MAKRADRNSKSSKSHASQQYQKENNVSAFRGASDWDPLHEKPRSRRAANESRGSGAPEERRDQRYVKNVKPQTPGQALLWDAIHKHNLTLAVGPAGTGKTYLAISAAVEALEAGKVDRVILSRPAIEAGESIGYLPGDINDKMAPFLRPLTDALMDRIGGKRLKQYMADGTIEIAPVAYMRGRTLNNAFIVIDEAQNCTYTQIKMLLTRLGWASTMILTGDPAQSDLLPGISGLGDIANKLSTVEGIGVVKLEDRDIVRHPLVASMLGVL